MDSIVQSFEDLHDLDKEENSMSKQVTGFVERIAERPVRTKRGNAMAYSLCVREDGAAEDTWYGNGFTRPDFREGSRVSFTANQNARGYWDIDGPVEVLKSESQAASGGGGAVSVVTDRNKSITMQTAFKVAEGLVGDMFTHGVLSFPKTKKDAFEAYLEIVDEVAYRLQARFLDPDAFAPEGDAEGEEEFGEFEE